jgi:uncharacterized membrane protein YfcA
MHATDLLLAALLFAVAVLYSSVGHAGASGYIASMALLGFAPEQVRPTALALNLLVGGIGLLHSGQSLPSMLPLWLGVVALGALLGTQLGLQWLPVRGLRRTLGVVLLIAAGKLLFA